MIGMTGIAASCICVHKRFSVRDSGVRWLCGGWGVGRAGRGVVRRHVSYLASLRNGGANLVRRAETATLHLAEK